MMAGEIVARRRPGCLDGALDDEMVSVTLTIKRSELPKLHAFMASDTFEKAQAARDASLDQCLKSIEHCFNLQRQHGGTSGGRVMATALASLYNGNRVKFDLSGVKSLDSANFEHLMNAIRLCFELGDEPHNFFEDGGSLFEAMISDWRLEKKRRAA